MADKQMNPMTTNHKGATEKGSGNQEVFETDQGSAPSQIKVTKTKSKKRNIKKPQDEIFRMPPPDENNSEESDGARIMHYWFQTDENAEHSLGLSRTQFTVLLRMAKQLPLSSNDEELHIKLMTALRHLASSMNFESLNHLLKVSYDSIDQGLLMLLKIVPKINVPFTADRLLANERGFYETSQIQGCMGFCGVFEVETDYVGDMISEGDPPQDKYMVFVVANPQNRLDYVEPFPDSYSPRQCLLKSKFYRDMLGEHSSQIPDKVTDRYTGKSTVKPYFHCAFEMTPKKGEQVKEEKFLVYSKGTRAVEELIGKKLIADIFLEAGMWFGALERNHKKGELPERMELIFRIMNAKGENFFGPGSGIKRVREPEILSNAGRRELRQRMKLFLEANKD